MHKRRFNQERRASARPSSVIRASCGQNRAMFGDWRTLNQERRALARRACDWTNVVRNVLETHLQARQRNHGGLTPPALALLCECPPAKNDFCGGQTQVQPRAATVSPPWVLGKCTCRNAAAKSRETAIGAFTNPGAVAVAKPRGAYAPPLLVARCWFAGEMAIFPIRERIFTGAAGVSPPLFGHPGVVRSELRNVRRLANTESRAAGVSPPWCFGHTIAVPQEANVVQRRANTRPGAAGVSPPWFGDPGLVRSQSRNVRRLAHAESRAATVSPPSVWLGECCP
jgi:hypothetical protein